MSPDSLIKDALEKSKITESKVLGSCLILNIILTLISFDPTT